jgi:exopolysaccharide production protein ExoQ
MTEWTFARENSAKKAISSAGQVISPERARKHNRLHRQLQLAKWVAMQIEFLLVLLFFVPLGGDVSATAQGGSSFFRTATIAMLLGASLGLIHHIGRVLDLIKRTLPILLLFLWFFVSAAWASYPDLTVRRAGAYVVIYLIALSLAVSMESPTDFQKPLYRGLFIVFVLNLVALRGLTATDMAMGTYGIYAAKNAAGAVALYVVIVTSFSVVLGTRLTTKALSLVIVVMAWGFLIASRAKTSLGIAVVLSIALPFLGYTLTQAKPYRLLVVVGGIFLLGCAFFAFQVFNLTGQELELAVVGDTTFTDRTAIWTGLAENIRTRPWEGCGFGSFWSTGQLFNPILGARRDEWFMSAELINEAHNGYIDIVLQTGFIGLAIYLVVIVRSIWACCSAISASQLKPPERVACTMILGFSVALALGNLTESLIFAPSNPAGYLFLLMAVQAERWKVTTQPVDRPSSARRVRERLQLPRELPPRPISG